MSFLENAIRRVARRLGATNPNEFPKAVSLNPEFPRAGRGSYNLGSSFPTTRFAGWGFPSADQLKSFAAGQKAALGGQPTTAPGTPSSPYAPGSLSQTNIQGLDPWLNQINTYSQKYGVHPGVFAAAMMQESGGNPYVVGDSGESGGLFGIHVRGRGAGRRGDQMSPEEQFDLSGREFQNYWNQYSQLPERERILRTIAAAQRYAGYEDLNTPQSQDYAGWLDRVTPYFQGSTQQPNTSNPYRTRGVNQFQLGLSYEEALAACGPAALMFMASEGRTPTAQEAMQLARQSGWNAQAGMGGVGNFQRMAQAAGIPTGTRPFDWQNVMWMAQQGQPVVLSSPEHYYQVTGFDPTTGQFDFGGSVEAIPGRSRGRTRFTPQEFEQAFGGGWFPDTTIFRRQ